MLELYETQLMKQPRDRVFDPRTCMLRALNLNDTWYFGGGDRNSQNGFRDVSRNRSQNSRLRYCQI